ncbi:mannosyltransferase family protein [Streptomyces sp. NPDC002730]|uniref:mannosyltransferase family protein n=1 Tax=Streptomyces sp. NPDC002730 TaxID=3364662 RepID=UPI00369C7360
MAEAKAPWTPAQRPVPTTTTPYALSPDTATAGRPQPRSGRRPERVVAYRLLPSLNSADRTVLSMYLLTRIGIWVTAYCTGWLFTGGGRSHQAPPLMSRWEQWDWTHFLNIAEDGYFPGSGGQGTGRPDNREAFFPGFPLALRAVHVVVPDWTVAGLVISFASGAVAVLALSRIAQLHLPGSRTGPRAVFFLLLSPCAVFLAAGYTEALFLACALPAWLAAKKGNWPLAAVLACLATTVRVSGIFLAVALVVEFATAGEGRRRWRCLPWLMLPALPLLAYTWYLQAYTGDWMAWKHAQERGWFRQFHAPWEAWHNTWDAAFSHAQTTGYALMFQAELVAMVVGVVLLCVLAIRRRWPEAAFIGLNLWALGTSYWYMSIPRASLLWWPLWVALAEWSLQRPWAKTAYICAASPLMTILAVAFTSGRWAG